MRRGTLGMSHMLRLKHHGTQTFAVTVAFQRDEQQRSHVTCMNASCHARHVTHVTSHTSRHTDCRFAIHVQWDGQQISHVTRMNASCHVMSYTSRHVTACHGTQTCRSRYSCSATNQSHYTYECVMSRHVTSYTSRRTDLSLSVFVFSNNMVNKQVTRMNASCHVTSYTSRHVMARHNTQTCRARYSCSATTWTTNKSHVWMRHVTHALRHTRHGTHTVALALNIQRHGQGVCQRISMWVYMM